MKTIVKFAKPWSIYSPGDVAGFDSERADLLIKGEIAQSHKEAVKPAAGKTADQKTGDDKPTDDKAADQKAGK
ncbi:hypothetical protein ACFQUU_08750 [Herbaspirillum sp. GCM10030257]|uniref:hypothetical protein n=1 Tax=Herbaspirillum sp. GCM10030257 TaxID=3273393 RepID=UPI003619E576